MKSSFLSEQLVELNSLLGEVMKKKNTEVLKKEWVKRQ